MGCGCVFTAAAVNWRHEMECILENFKAKLARGHLPVRARGAGGGLRGGVGGALRRFGGDYFVCRL